MWYAYTKDYSVFIKKERNVPHATTWMNLTDIILSKISQSQKMILYDSIYISHLT